MDTLYSHLEDKNSYGMLLQAVRKVTSVLWTGLDEHSGPERSINKQTSKTTTLVLETYLISYWLRESEPGQKE